MTDVYDSFEDVPEDVPLGEDGDDTQVPNGIEDHPATPPLDPVEQVRRSLATKEKLVVPFFPSSVRKNGRGGHVVAMRRALSRAGYLKWKGGKFLPTFGWGLWATLRKFQRDHGIPVTGRYDRKTHEKLARYYDQYGIKLLLDKKQAEAVTPETEKRNAFLAELMYLYNHRRNIAYTQARPWDKNRPPRGLDCSASGEWGCYHSGLSPLLSGFNVPGYGNTWTQESYLGRLGRRIPLELAKPGDCIYYRGHVAYYIGGGRVWSFGHYPIGIFVTHYRPDYQATYSLVRT